MANTHGGARKGAGKSTKPTVEKLPSSFDDIFKDIAPAEIQAIRESILARAKGIQQLTRFAKTGQGAGLREAIETIEGLCPHCEALLEEGGVIEKGYIYTIPPDQRVQDMLLAHTRGRPGQQQDEPIRPTFILKHNVPGFQDKVYQVDQPQPETELDAAEASSQASEPE